MKKILILACLMTLAGCCCEAGISASEKVRREANRSAVDAQMAAQQSVSVPTLSHFQERRTIAKWAKHWDKPSAACYVYLISHGTVIGYYVVDGKPSATTSYLTPEYREEIASSVGMRNVQLPDVDGTYGDNNPGIRFFTASGIAVEWGGIGATYLYSDVPLRINVPLLGD